MKQAIGIVLATSLMGASAFAEVNRIDLLRPDAPELATPAICPLACAR